MRDEVARALAARALEIANKTKAQRGEKGEKGDPGEIKIVNIPVPGEQGIQGIPGKSITGPQGDKGDTGEKGDKGDKGDAGAKGDRGENGKDGAKGDRGERGFQGPKGLDGIQGPLGPMPKHEKKGLMFRFEKEPGVWGEWIVVPTGGGGGGRDDKLTDRQKELIEIVDLYKAGSLGGGGGGGGITSITSTDGTIQIAQVGDVVDLSVAVAAATTNVILQVRNATGATLTKGTVVYITGATGQLPTVSKAIATSDSTSAQTLGVMSANLANNSNGYVTVIGGITNIDTSAYTDGQQLYLSPTTAGTLTATKPYAPNHLVYVAIVEHAHPTQGKLFVKVQNGYEMDELHNVSAQTPSNGNTLIYNTSNQLWEASNITNVDLTTGTISTAPSSSTDIVNKSYADSIASGVNFHAAVNNATTTALPTNTYSNGVSGVGATLTAVANGALTIDGTSQTAGNRVLVKDEAITSRNGVYTVTQVGSVALPYILTRATDYDSSGSGTNEIDAGDMILVLNGTSNANTSWVQQTPLPITIGTTNIVFIEFAKVQTYTAGTGLTLSTNQFSITNTGTAGTYGSASLIPVITTNAQGQVTGVTTASNPQGTVTSVDVSGGTTGLTTSGGPVTGSGTITIAGTLDVDNGGTGQTTYTNGQLLIGNTTGNTLTKATLTQGAGVSITNGTGSITIAGALAESTSAFTTGSAQTYTAPANTQWVKVTVVGPGGNGAASATGRATGGSGGGVAIKWLAMNAGQTLTYTVGTASGTASSVSSGTLTITTITANSGSNGTSTAYAASLTAGPTGGTATGGDVNMAGGRGGNSYGSSTTITTNFSGAGGNCPGFGNGGQALAFVATAGQAGTGYGAGGGGAIGSATAANGTGGIIIFEAY